MLMQNLIAELRRVASKLSLELNDRLATGFASSLLHRGLRHTASGIAELNTKRGMPRIAGEVFGAIREINKHPSVSVTSNRHNIFSEADRFLKNAAPIFEYISELERRTSEFHFNPAEGRDLPSRLLRFWEEEVNRLHNDLLFSQLELFQRGARWNVTSIR